ncbi:hypothetical protein QFC22_005795 [Naganishia vaughanmartiniae]|uniref:Uncharacterized protein n=1 Tax=Naganishia vaughanmartiniae TaxID=1424756 RepID=A0ACC2WQS5_9TREE|nr:hypothetical protein QFC22_005795 [Naganishia vaughanmartiniae]
MSPDPLQTPSAGNSTFQIDFLTVTIKDLQGYLADKRTTSVELVQAYLDRIEANNRKGLELRAVMETPPVRSLLEIARTCDKMRAEGHPLGKLHGIPLLVKDNIATDPKLGMHTTAGSYALVNSIPKEDATVIAKLRAAGAIILGKTTMTEFGNCKYSKADWGWSARGGQPLSAYVAGGYPNANPDGSSSGSAISVSAGWAPGALGTETNGSLILPAGRAAGYALRSTAGLISCFGVVPISATIDTVGPITKSAYDTALLLECMSGYDAKDPATIAAQGHTRNDYTLFTKLPHATFTGKRIGVPRHGILSAPSDSLNCRDATINLAFQVAIEKMESLGVTICDPTNLPSYDEWLARFEAYADVIIQADVKEGLADYLSKMQSSEVVNLREIIDFNVAHADLELPPGQSGQDLLLEAEASEGTQSAEYIDAKASLKRICKDEGIDKVMDQYQLDALIFPTNGLATGYAAYGGYPIAAVPLGVHKNGEPFGFCFLGRKWSEPALIALMAAYEANFPLRATPTLL